MLSTMDIMKDLGVTKQSVLRWVRLGKLKGTIESRRCGWKFEEQDYEAFLDDNPTWRAVHDGDTYTSNAIKAREDALSQIIAKIIAIKGAVNMEVRDDEYVNGVNRAISDITSAINYEMTHRSPA